MRLLVTGAAGMLGQDVVREAEARDHHVSAHGREELDITDVDEVRDVVLTVRPDAVINCAAFTNVDGAESQVGDAMLVNAYGPSILSEAAAMCGASVLQVSTDYVFDGHASRPYVESDPVAPIQVYGESKLTGERGTAAYNERHFIVRSSWLFGAGGGNFVETMLRLARERGALRVVDDQRGCPTFTGHLANAIVDVVASDAYGVHHIAASDACSWYQFAGEIFSQARVDVDLTPCSTDDFPRPAARPAYSVLGTERSAPWELPSWQAGLAEYFHARVGAR